MDKASTIGPLKKVCLQLEAFSKDGVRLLRQAPVDFVFIYGIGIGGITSFEKVLHGKAPGERLRVQINPFEVQGFFEHLRHPLMNALKIEPPFDLGVQVHSVTPVSNRELVQSLAKNSDGCGGDCGCGCGN